MKIKNIIKTIALSMVVLSCSAPKEELQITISSDIINADYIGNGVEWDPYDEAEAWGSSISEADWQKLFKRLDFMRMGYVRCMINSPFRYYDAETGKYDKTRNIESLSRVLKYCTDNNITVMYGEYNPPTWDMKVDQKWVDMSVDYLNYLVNDLGFSCIKYFVIFNEPDGDWASTNGDYELWKSMLLRFHTKMKEYPGLSEKVKFAAPDAVMDFKNPASAYDAIGWVKQTANDVDSIVGLYDLHAYPGQYEVRSGKYADILARHKEFVPKDKKIVLGEAGYKYWREADSLLMKEYNRRTEGHPFTKGSDSNMLVYDYFYGLDMPLLCMEVMNGGYSGIAAWMLDDAMHSSGDSGKTEDIKLWGMWNILGEEVFNEPSQEEIRPWYYTWSLMCRYFPSETNILKTTIDRTQGIYMVAAEHNGKHVLAAVNIGETDKNLNISLPVELQNVSKYLYEENNMKKNEDGHPVPTETSLNIGKEYKTILKAQSFILLTNMD
ncbi:hypothetical protein M2451_001477 [Dysgonomonas sp. PFB1-18]|uniref:hypothetical protein n=1 Tax=unclassified Dysgonomonas TaxID=2630389 RepID=UPI0024772536|nr:MULTISPECIES: hypothetical protein [unclassified Dysgonomonas]MDH6309065.1 hypothetical protein [Dysgonomonas sp. PF1-14]MDH6338816.1 hypothetical protein [Dysgonomonas sp. PF1-16]MDH6380156.1 hypothetical protein [Dysgonomonas sp. PFB1-18]MDH6397486.1 hypothetical protein [Dysgonomonas sp. PF1-23]